jgi:hypothetical protein
MLPGVRVVLVVVLVVLWVGFKRYPANGMGGHARTRNKFVYGTCFLPYSVYYIHTYVYGT